MDTPANGGATARKRRRILRELALGAILVAALLGGPWAEAGPYGWAALLQLRWSGSFNDKWTMVLSVVIWAVLAGVGWRAWVRLFGEASIPRPGGAAGPPEPPAGRTWVPAGICLAGVLLGVAALGVLALPAQTRALGSPEALGRGARPWPMPVAEPDWSGSPWVDLGATVGLIHGEDRTHYVPIHPPGSPRLAGWIVVPAVAGSATLDLKAGVVTLEPVPLVVRRSAADAGLEGSLFMPMFHPGRTRLDVVIPGLIAGVVVAGMGGYLWRLAWKAPAA